MTHSRLTEDGAGMESDALGNRRSYRALSPTILALVLVATVLIGPSLGRDASAAGWKEKLKSAGILKTRHSSGMIHAASHIKALAKAKLDPAEAAVHKLKIHVPAHIRPGPMNTLEPLKTALYLQKLAARRDLNPARFDHYHPTIGALLNAQQLLSGPNGTSPAAIALAQKALLPDTIYYRYFEARRALNPARFDMYHPLFGPLLAENQNVNNSLDAAQILNPPTTESVPEPGVLTLMLIGIVGVAGWRRRALLSRSV